MKSQFAKLGLFSSKVNRQHVQLAMTILALIMLVLGIGAPSDGGGGVR
jgi:hypothetical protein